MTRLSLFFGESRLEGKVSSDSQVLQGVGHPRRHRVAPYVAPLANQSASQGMCHLQSCFDFVRLSSSSTLLNMFGTRVHGDHICVTELYRISHHGLSMDFILGAKLGSLNAVQFMSMYVLLTCPKDKGLYTLFGSMMLGCNI